jgi:ABC-type lipoprotein release transport system permease subunit
MAEVMRYLLEIAQTGLVAALLHPLRSSVSVAALVVALVPYLVGTALSKGIEEEAEASVRFGPDLHVRGSQFGRPAPMPLAAVKAVSDVRGVSRVVPRIVGEVTLGEEQIRCVLVGMPAQDYPDWAACIDGKPPADGGAHQLVIGTELARRLGLKVGSRLPPFYRNDRLGERTSVVVGVFRPEAPLWQARLILTTLGSAAAIFDQPGHVTDLLVSCEPGAADDAAREIAQLPAFAGGGASVRTEVITAREMRAWLAQGPRYREGVFALHFVLAFFVAILVLLVTSGMGLGERRREVGILKATGWQTDEVLLRGAAESAALSACGAAASLLLAWAWLRLLGGYGLAAVFVPGLDAGLDFPLPFRLTPVPALLGLVLSFVIVLTGTLYSTWRAAVAPPRESMR